MPTAPAVQWRRPRPRARSSPSTSRPPRPVATAPARWVSLPGAGAASCSRERISSGRLPDILRSRACMAWGGKTYATRRPSPSCGRRSVPGSSARPSSSPTTPRSTAVCCTPAAPVTGCARRPRALPAPCRSLGRSGESVRRSCRMSVGDSASRCDTTMRVRTLWLAHASCLQPKPTAGSVASDERAQRRLARSNTLHDPGPVCEGLTPCTGGSSNGCTSNGGACAAAS